MPTIARRIVTAAAIVATIVWTVGLSVADPVPHPSQTPPPDVAAPSPTPAPLLVNGQIIDDERGFVVFSSGDAFRLSASAVTVDADTGAPPTFAIEPGIYGVASLDPATGLVVQLRVSRRPLAEGTPAALIPRKFVVEASSPQPNPDLVPRKSIYSGSFAAVETVTMTVQVPANTPFTDDVYLATDTSAWNPQAIKMQRMDGLHFRIQFQLKGGSDFHFLFTRGSWATVERDRAGLARKPRELFAPGGAAQDIAATVFRWADLP